MAAAERQGLMVALKASRWAMNAAIVALLIWWVLL